ncbi:MAG: hypothetical protein R6U63_05265 [Longimicrobiales bacterium]
MEAVIVTSGGRYLVVGGTEGGEGDDAWVVAVEPDGSIAWQKTYGIAGVYDEALSVGMTDHGGALIGGSYYEDGDADWSWTLARVGPDGALSWNRSYERSFDWPNSVVELSDDSAGASCAPSADQTIAEEVTTVSPVASSATVTDAAITPQTTSASVTDTGEGHAYDCSDG